MLIIGVTPTPALTRTEGAYVACHDEVAGGRVVDDTGARFSYGKWTQGLKNPSFVAWGRQILG